MIGVRMTSYRGVRKRSWGQWLAYGYDRNRKQIGLGSFETAEMAAKAYDAYAFHRRGSKARLNFPENAANLPSFPSNPTHHDIRMLARQSAEIAPMISNSVVSPVPIPVHVTQSPSQIKALCEWPMYSPGNDNVGF